VSIAIIGVLVSLSLPAVQSAREASRTAQCLSGLRQVAIATHNYCDAHSGRMPYNVGEGDLWEKQQSAMYALLPFAENNETMFRCPGDQGSMESATPFWDTFATSYKMEGRAFSEPALPARTVQEYDFKKGEWKSKNKKAKPEVLRTLTQHTQGVDIKKALEGKSMKPEDLAQSSRIQLARDLFEPWKSGEVKSHPLRGIYTMRPFHSTHFCAAFVGGNTRSFTSKTDWELFRGKNNGSKDDDD
jgi:hypothetical protein